MSLFKLWNALQKSSLSSNYTSLTYALKPPSWQLHSFISSSQRQPDCTHATVLLSPESLSRGRWISSLGRRQGYTGPNTTAPGIMRAHQTTPITKVWDTQTANSSHSVFYLDPMWTDHRPAVFLIDRCLLTCPLDFIPANTWLEFGRFSYPSGTMKQPNWGTLTTSNKQFAPPTSGNLLLFTVAISFQPTCHKLQLLPAIHTKREAHDFWGFAAD